MTNKELLELKPSVNAMDWLGSRAVAECWSGCERGDLMLWLLARKCNAGAPWPDHRLVVELACRCAETVAHLWRGDAPANAIRAARACIARTATIKDLRDAAAAGAAYAADDSAYAAGESARKRALARCAEIVRDLVPELPK